MHKIPSVTRRALLLGTAAGVGGGLLARSGKPPTAAGAATVGIQRWFQDSTIDVDGEFRLAAHRAGMQVALIEQDIGALAMQFDARWQTDSVAVAGVTLPSALFILEQLAVRHAMAVTLVGEHHYQRDGYWRHEILAAAGSAGSSHASLASPAWRPTLCRRVVQAAAYGSGAARSGLRVQVLSGPHEPYEGPTRFVSWAIVPQKYMSV